MYCRSCGHRLRLDDDACHRCGWIIPRASQTAEVAGTPTRRLANRFANMAALGQDPPRRATESVTLSDRPAVLSTLARRDAARARAGNTDGGGCFCLTCGTRQPLASPYCHVCGAAIETPTDESDGGSTDTLEAIEDLGRAAEQVDGQQLVDTIHQKLVET